MQGEIKKMRRTTTRKYIIVTSNPKDRLSELPDPILTHILSFLDTKYAVQTSSLSKRWINLWICLTNLNFHNSSFRTLTTFQRFIDHVLAHRDSSICLNRLVFSCRRNVTFNFLEKVINYATSNRVIHLDICIYRSRFYSITNSMFSAVSLTTLKLRALGCRDIETRFCFEKLRFLSLHGFSFDGSDLFSECPNLVELSIVDCDVRFSKKLVLSAPRLEKLNISFGKFSSHSEIVLSVPKLNSFNFKATKPVVLRTDELLHLKTVMINLDSYYAWYGTEEQKMYSINTMNMLQKLHNAEHVSLSMPTIELLYVITGPMENPPLPFGNLKSLIIIVGSLEQPFHFGKYPSKLIGPHKRISLNILNQVINYLLQNSPQAEMVIQLPR